jgi:hypothetical protein
MGIERSRTTSASGSASAAMEFRQVIRHLVHQPQFQIRGAVNYFQNLGDNQAFDIRFKAPNHFWSAWVLKQGGRTSQPFILRRRPWPSDLEAILSDFLLPRGKSDYQVLPTTPSETFRRVEFGPMLSLGPVRTIGVDARGYPWTCGPLYAGCPAHGLIEGRYRATLFIDDRTGLPNSYISVHSLFGKNFPGQKVTFFYVK